VKVLTLSLTDFSRRENGYAARVAGMVEALGARYDTTACFVSGNDVAFKYASAHCIGLARRRLGVLDPLFVSRSRHKLSGRHYDLVIACGCQVVPWALALSAFGKAKRLVYDAHNFETALASELSLPRTIAVAGIEFLAARRCNGVFFVSPNDMRDFRKTFRGPFRPFLLPNSIDCTVFHPHRRGAPRQRARILFFGDFGYKPNRQALAHIARTAGSFGVEEAEFVVAGRGSTEAVAGFATMQNLSALGWVEDMPSLVASSDLVAVPLDSGGGTRFKILEAAAAGVPVLSTPTGAQGLDLVDGREIFLADAERFDAALRRILADRDLARRVADAGRRKVLSRYSLPAFRKKLHAAVEELCTRDTAAMP